MNISFNKLKGMEPASKLMPQNILRTAPPQVEIDMFKIMSILVGRILLCFEFAFPYSYQMNSNAINLSNQNPGEQNIKFYSMSQFV